MNKSTFFSSFHPSTATVFFTAVLLITSLTQHPALLAVSFAASLCTAAVFKRRGLLKYLFCFVLPASLLCVIINPLFNHRGVTPLFYLGVNAVTLESIIYGAVEGVMLASVLLWFVSLNAVLTGDKIRFLFARAFPTLALLVSMTLRIIPELVRSVSQISQARRNLLSANKSNKLREALSVFSAASSRAFENSLTTAVSMKSRGFATAKRKTFSLYKFSRRDLLTVCAIAVMGTAVLIASLCGVCEASYYPALSFSFDTGAKLCCALFLILAFIPVIVQIRGEVKWHILRSKI